MINYNLSFNNMLGKKIITASLIGLVFFIISLKTIGDYNLMWDGRGHFTRGKAFLHLLLTGESTYVNKEVTPDFVRYYKDYLIYSGYNFPADSFKIISDPPYRKSIYKNIGANYYWENNAYGHPPISDIGAAVFNDIFFEKLGWLRDDLAYNLFAVFLSSILVGVVFHWMRRSYGIFPAIISALTLSTYPLFWAESHFNIKDVPQMVFFALAIWTFWQGIVSQSRKWVIVSSIFAGCSLATKFNILFLPLIIIPWFLFFYFRQSKEQRRIYYKWWWLIIVYPLIMLSILFISYPYLWPHPWQNLLNVILYYKNIGTSINYTPLFSTFFEFSTYPILWITFTTYPMVIALTIIGVITSIIGFFKKQKDRLPLLFLIWLMVPVLRVMVPQSAIYDGVRQIMEYIPALSLIAGYGSFKLIKLIPQKYKNIISFLIIISFFPLIATLVRLHPAENAYFNSLIGGIKGAKEMGLTGWGNTDGGIYTVAVNWLNGNAEKNSHVSVGFSETSDFHIPSLRKDLVADNQFSGYLQKGEYIVALTHDSGLENTYKLSYPENTLTPLYKYEIDGVSLVKIWKNDKKYLKEEASGSVKNISLLPQRRDGGLLWDLGRINRIVSIEINFEKNNACKPLVNAFFQVSENGVNWKVLPETYPSGGYIDTLGKQPNNNRLIAPIANIKAKYVNLISDPSDACILNVKKSNILTLE